MRGDWLLREYMRKDVERATAEVQIEPECMKGVSCQVNVATAEATCQTDLIKFELKDKAYQTTDIVDKLTGTVATETMCQTTHFEMPKNASNEIVYVIKAV